MTDLETFRAFADGWIPKLAEAIRNKDFKAFKEPFDPVLDDDLDENHFLSAIEEEQDGLGYLQEHTHLGQIKRNAEDHPGQIRFVYAGHFTQSEGLIILSVVEREGQLYLTEHVYYWD